MERMGNKVQVARVEGHGISGIMRTRSDKTLPQKRVGDYHLSHFITIGRVTPQVIIVPRVSLAWQL